MIAHVARPSYPALELDCLANFQNKRHTLSRTLARVRLPTPHISHSGLPRGEPAVPDAATGLLFQFLLLPRGRQSTQGRLILSSANIISKIAVVKLKQIELNRDRVRFESVETFRRWHCHTQSATDSTGRRPAPIGLVSQHFDFPFVRGDKSNRSHLCRMFGKYAIPDT